MAATSSFPKLSFIPSDSAFIFVFIPTDIYFNCDFTLSRQRLHPSPSSRSLSLLPTALSSSFSFLPTYISIVTSLFHGSDFILPQALFHSFVFIPSGVYFNFDFILSRRPLHPSVSSLSFLPTALSSSFSLIPAYISIATSFFHSGHLILARVLFHSFRQHFHLLRFHSCRCTFQSRQWPLHPLLDCVSFLPSGYIM